ncbi:DUF1906 domain-containing protein [Desulfosporosinus sp. PR]|uniref:DUF1906 domain-containing protein n=1 Tax=Candidatus Desulfosporosinus nitrosoreducens TaxID=3401928 RepID=UPI0028001CBB|nr:DUF1906 domain-containing protein [Desulfosporosinus sp. PR]MDQ7096957.1 DUF1906 domain-containing protein [Desulfosporosinus sp. PR]
MDGIDCATRLTAESAQALKQAGIMAVGRYLGDKQGWAKALTPDEANVILSAGLAIFLIWESEPTNKSYFTSAQGISDAASAIVEVEYLGVPDGVAIYFTVDYDAQANDIASINDYFQGVKNGLGGKYLLGAYGSYVVMKSVTVDRYFQTYAWSGGQTAPNHIYQYSNDVELVGVAVDRDYVNEDAGLWKKGEEEMDVAVVYFTANDYSIAKAIADLHGGCAMFCRNGNAGVHSDAKKAAKVFNVGGPALGWSNEVYMSGDKALDTVNAVAQAYAAGKLS